MVPKGWSLSSIGKHVELLTGFPFESNKYTDSLQDVRLLRGDNVCQGYVRWRGAKFWPANQAGELSRYSLRSGDIVIAMDRTWIPAGVKISEIKSDDLPCLLVQRVCRLRAKSTLEQRLLHQWLSSHRFEQHIKKVQTETAVPHISPDDIREFPILLPPLSEQQQIAEILAKWDQAISLSDSLILNSERRKRWLAQRLLTGGLRSSRSAWESVMLAEVCTRVTAKNSQLNDNVLTISGQHGLIKQEDFFTKRVASESLENYFVLSKGQFAYNKSYSNGYPMGAIKRLTQYEAGVVTTLYICFEVSKPDRCDPAFLEHYFEQGMLNQGLSKIAHEGGRAHGLLNVKPSDFFNLIVDLPPLTEQRRIAEILSTADAETKLLERKANCLRQEKVALMQKLLTGKVRFACAGPKEAAALA
jgi:type I restriction enzyme, S subunit